MSTRLPFSAPDSPADESTNPQPIGVRAPRVPTQFAELKCASVSESAQRIRASLERRNTDPGNTLASVASAGAQAPRAFAPLPFPERKPQAQLQPRPVEPVFLGAMGRSLDTARSLPTRVWAVSGVVASLTILALALPFPMKLTGRDRENPIVNAAPAPVQNPMAFIPYRSALSGAGAARRVSIRVNQPVWMSACADGQEIFQTMFSPGNMANVRFASKAIVRIGNAGGVDLSIDGDAMDPLGPKGEIRILELTNAGFRQLTLQPGDARHDCEIQ